MTESEKVIETINRALHAFILEQFPDAPWPLIAGALGIYALQVVASGPDDPAQVEEVWTGFYAALHVELQKTLDIRRQVDVAMVEGSDAVH